MREAAKALVANQGFNWRMFSPGAVTCSRGPFKARTNYTNPGSPNVGACTGYLRQQCSIPASDPASVQGSALMYGLTGAVGCRPPPQGQPPLDFEQHLAAFLLIRGPYAWLGWNWVGCGATPLRPAGMDGDYGEPVGLCKETAPQSQIFERNYTKAKVTLNCAEWEGHIDMH
jgi:hypothetical protein|eukprot:COSAG03_NODE_137_length_11785_cov_19.757827_7_plen_172_part_00